MRGSRAKALKQAFEHRFNRPPRRMTIVESKDDGSVAYVPSEWRRLKKAFMEARRA